MKYPTRILVAVDQLVAVVIFGTMPDETISAMAVSEAQAAYVIRGLVQQSIAASYAIDGTAFSGSISDEDITRIVQAVLNATAIPVDMKKTNGITIMGTGSRLSPWRPA